MKILFIGLLTLSVAATATDSTYSVQQKDTSEGLEYRFKYHAFHFMTLIDKDGEFILRPHPGCDKDGWGTSLYAQPFLPGAKLKHTTIESVSGNSKGIHTEASGKVSRGDSDTYGDWSSDFDFTYDQDNKEIKGHGTYTISLQGHLSKDLNLFKIASNYLQNVPLLSGEKGDTGDMKEAKVNGDDDFSHTWIPDKEPDYFPTDKTDRLSINVKEQYNQVDAVELGYEKISPALKPSLKVILDSNDDGTGIMFGAMYDTDKKKGSLC